MTPYYQDDLVTLYCADAREVLATGITTDSVITDPVWPNSVFPNVPDPEELCRQVLELVRCERIVVQLGCDSDPRFLRSVPNRFKFFRVCWLEYVRASYKARLLYTGDVAYVFGSPPPARAGATVLPGRCTSTRTDEFVTGNRKSEAFNPQKLPHPAPRRYQHVRWLVKWFGGGSVLDPFCGSGTTLAAAKDLGIPAIGIEIEEKYCEVAVKRLRQRILRFDEPNNQNDQQLSLVSG